MLPQIKALKPLASPSRGFAEAEYHARLQKAQERMAKVGMDAILLNSEPDVRYFTGYLTQFWQSPTRPWYLLLPQSGKPVAVIPSIGAECMGRTWIEDIRTWSSPHETDDGISLLAETVSGIAGAGARIGLMRGRETLYRAPLDDLARLQASLPQSEWPDATAIIQGLRVIKSEAEIEKIGYIASVASAAFDLVPELLSEGMSEIEAFRAFKIACLQLGADDVPFLVGGAGPGGYGDIISPPSSRPLQEGDVLILDTGCIWDGYFCDFDRNFAVGSVSDEVHRAHEICWQATEAGINAARPGATCADLFHAMNAVMEPHAIQSGGEVGRLGHGLGMQLTEFPSHTFWDKTVLEPGMVLTIEPGYAFAQGKMLVHEEDIVVRDGKAQLLTRRASKSLPVIGKS